MCVCVCLEKGHRSTPLTDLWISPDLPPSGPVSTLAHLSHLTPTLLILAECLHTTSCPGSSAAAVPVEPGELVVELSLREHFSVPRASAGFLAMLSQLPALFVGHAEQLDRLTASVSSLMALEYEAQVRACMHAWCEHGAWGGPPRPDPKP